MARLILFLVLLAGLAAGAGWIADRPGQVSIIWLGRQIEFDVLVGLVAAAALALVLFLVIGFMGWLISGPAKARRAMRERRLRKGQDAVTAGILAIGAGDRRVAEKNAREAARLSPNHALTMLLQAQTAQLAGDRPAAEKAFRAMLERDDTKVLGLRGLHVEALRRQDATAAQAIAEEAAKVAPSAAWAVQAALEHRSGAGDWDGALAMVERQAGARLIDKDQTKRLKAVLLTAKAMAAEAADPFRARALAVEAHGLAPALVPAAALAGRLLVAEGETRKASKILEATWKLSAHPDIAEVYAGARPGDSARDRMKRVETLVHMQPASAESALSLARAAIDAGAFDVAHRALERLANETPTQRFCLLSAELAAKETNDQGRAREWMARALRAPRDAAWTADGQVSDHWLPISPVTGRLDAFEWRTPLAEIGGPVLHVDDVLADASEPSAPLIVVEPIAEPEKAAAPAVEPEPAPVSAPAPAVDVAKPEPTKDAPPDAASADPAKLDLGKQDPAKNVTPLKRPATPAETVFPLARAPDDPGPETPSAPPRRAGLFGG